MASWRTFNTERLPPKASDALPDSTEPHGPCPRCGRISNFTVGGQAPVTFNSELMIGNEPDVLDRLTVLTCQGCRQNVVVVEEQCIGGVARRNGGSSGTVQWRGIHWWPTPGMQSADPDIPEAVADAVAEGTRCLAVGAPRAAAVMYRGALAEVVTDRGSSAAQGKRSLAAQLKQMGADGVLDATLADWADHIRVLGNAGAHPNELEAVSPEEAEELNRLITSLLDYLYVMPAQVRRRRAARP